MRELTDDMVLYHGSYCEVPDPDLRQCARYKDFGQGFYLTTSKEQAESFSSISIKKAVANGIIAPGQQYGIVSAFKLAHVEKFSIKMYPTADPEWLHCVVAHRRKKNFPEVVRELRDFDVVAGKIANDNTNATITAYMAGTFGDIGSRSADEICISLLLPERLRDQFCFRTNKAIGCLTFVESERIWL